MSSSMELLLSRLGCITTPHTPARSTVLVPDSAGSLPHVVFSTGNHEEEVTDGHEGFLAYESRFYFPAEESRSGSPFYYSYEVAGAHVVMLGCYVEYGTDSDQYAWLRADLATVDRQRTPWLIVGMHAPWYLLLPAFTFLIFACYFLASACHGSHAGF